MSRRRAKALLMMLSYAVQEANPPHALLPVRPGLFAAGYVQISGPGVYQGLQVTDSQG